MSLKDQIQDDMKSAMKAGEKVRLGTIRMLLAAIKQREVDERTPTTDAHVLAVVQKLIKQRREAATQFADAGRSDLESRELAEAEILSAYLPRQLEAAEVAALIDEAIAAAGASSIRDMGKVMAVLRERAQGRVDMGQLSSQVKARLGAG